MSDTPAVADFTLPERCGSSCAHDLAAVGLNLAPGTRLRIEAGAVERMSCAAIVVLISLAQTLAKTGGAMVVDAPTNAFTGAFADLGLYESLMNMEFAQ
jgi:anti-anti-sigma regulatory factor